MFKSLSLGGLSWKELAKRAYRETLDDNILGYAAQLSYYFLLALFPALLFLVAIVSFIPISGLLDAITGSLARVAPTEVISLLTDQVLKIAHEQKVGLLTFGILGTIWSTSAGMRARSSSLISGGSKVTRRSSRRAGSSSTSRIFILPPCLSAAWATPMSPPNGLLVRVEPPAALPA